MNYYMNLIFLAIFTLWQCSPNNEVQAVSDTNNIAAPAKPLAIKNLQDSIPPMPSRKMMVDRSRKKDLINSKYPFDIPLENTSKEVAPSSELIPNNGQPTLVLFWLTTCYPCRIEMKAIAEKYDQWRAQENFNIVAISTDWDKNYDNFVKMVAESNWPWESYRDLNREFRRIMPGELNGLPQSFIFDKNGEIAYHSRKYRTGDEDKIFDKIKSLNSH